MSASKKILLTGGGSAGHVVPNLALLTALKQRNWQTYYIGSKGGIERGLIAKAGVPYFAITTGKLRRYFSWRTFLTPFKIMAGIWQAWWLCSKIKPGILFSKGGFVAIPVVIAAWLWRIPVVIHESDFTPGLTNRLSQPFAKRICITFPESAQFFPKEKVVYTGGVVRPELRSGNAKRGLEFCGFSEEKPLLLVYGGGLGATAINKTVWEALPELLSQFQIAHICGQGKMNEQLQHAGYRQFEYLHEEFADVIAAAALVVARAGSNTLNELLVLNKPNLVVPLPKIASRGDQIDNAHYFAKLGYSQVLLEEELTAANLITKVRWLFAHRAEIVVKLQESKNPDSVAEICDILAELVKKRR